MFIAHKNSNQNIQTVEHHLLETSQICRLLARKINVPLAGELLGLMHDFGKYSSAFQSYIQSATNMINPDEDDYVDAKGLKGKIDHSTAGAQWIFQVLDEYADKTKGISEVMGQMLAICIVSHHSGLINSFDFPKGTDNFFERMKKSEQKAHLQECIQKSDVSVLAQAKELANQKLMKELHNVLKPIWHDLNNKKNMQINQFYLGHYTRLLFSCLIDADRLNSRDFEDELPIQDRLKQLAKKPNWNLAIETLESHLTQFPIQHEIDHQRQYISEKCKIRAQDGQGIYTLSVPTGGGKTLASLRYALYHARQHGLDRIIFIIPYTSIIEQNAQAVRDVLGQQENGDDWVLEHHSNIEPEQQTWLSKIISENWDAPIVFTTMVQFLESNFGGGTRSVRRLHQMANSILIFDEIQTLPIKCTYLFVNSINFLTKYATTTTVLCTATQPTLDLLDDAKFGQLELSEKSELMGTKQEVLQLFEHLERVDIINKMTAEAWSLAQMSDFAVQQFQQTSSLLFIVNTKALAQQLYQSWHEQGINPEFLFHLSTNQCSEHRKTILKTIRTRLKQSLPVLCVSTQLIEAGVDISTKVVIRCLAGLDSIAQAAGRCNRHGEMQDEQGNPIKGKVYVINPAQENLDKLPDIKQGRESAQRIFNELKGSSDSILSPKIIQRYFKYYFYERKSEMPYKFEDNKIADNVFNLLGQNKPKAFSLNAYKDKTYILRQAFKKASEEFKVIDAPTQAVIVPYGIKGVELINDLYSLEAAQYDYFKRLRDLQRQAQKYSINIFPFVWQKLIELQAIKEVPNTGIYTLNEQYYHNKFGLSLVGDGKMDNCIF